MRRIVQLLIAQAVALVGCQPTNQTVKAQLNVDFFNFFSKSGHHVIDREIPKITIPNITLPFTTPVGYGDVATDELRIEKFQTPHIDFVLSKEGISWKTYGGGVKLTGRWGASFTELVTVHDSGWLTAVATDIRLGLSATVFEVDGRPQISIGDCTVEIVHLDVEIGGSVISWLVNLFKSPFSSLIKKIIHEQACTATKGILLEQANEFLHAMPSHINIGKNFSVDYFLVGDPKASSEFAQFDVSALVVYGNSSCQPMAELDWSDRGSDPRMVTAWLSDAVPNCLFSSAHEGQLMQFNLTKDVAAAHDYLKTSCGLLSFCIGRVYPSLGKKFRNQFVDVFFHTYKKPYLILEEKKGIQLNATMAVDLFLSPKEKNPNILARLVLDSLSEVEPKFTSGRIGGELINSTMTLREEFSNVGPVSPLLLTTFAGILRVSVNEALKTFLKVGVPLPGFDNVTLADTTQLNVFDGFLRLNIDFDYKL